MSLEDRDVGGTPRDARPLEPSGDPSARRLAALLLQSSPRAVRDAYATLDRRLAPPEDPGGPRAAERRRRLAATVRRASRLLLDELSPDELARALASISLGPRVAASGSAATWLVTFLSLQRSLFGAARGGGGPHGHGRFRVDAAFARTFHAGGHVLRAPSDPLGGLGVKVVGGGLEIMILERDALIMSCAGMVKVKLPMAVPETLAIASAGRLLGELLDHPLLVGRDYRILEAVVDGDVTVVTAWAGVADVRVVDADGGLTLIGPVLDIADA